MRKIKITFSLILLFLLVACSNEQENQNKETGQKEKLVIWSYYETEAQKAGLDWLIEGFNKSQDQYEASWEYVPMTDFTKKLAMAYTEEALPDIALLDNPNMMVCIQMGMCEDITDFLNEIHLNENYYPATIETVTYENRGYGIPAVCNNLALIYNKKMLKEAGINPPQTWEELQVAAYKLTSGNRKGFLISAMEGEQGAFQLLPWILSTEEKKDSIGGAGTEKALQYLYNLMDNGCMTKNCINLSQTDVATAFINGETAMMENGPWVFSMLDEAGVDYGVSKLPIDKKSCVIVGGEDFTIMKGKNVEGAKLFFKYYDQNSVMSEFCERTYALPTKVSIKEYQVENMEIFREQMKSAVVRSSIPQWTALSDAIPTAFYKLTSGEMTPKQAAESIGEEIN